VTLDDVRRVAQRLYKPEMLTVVIVGPNPAKAPAATPDKQKGKQKS
jgi:predicted Zn-dependent peptidase